MNHANSTFSFLLVVFVTLTLTACGSSSSTSSSGGGGGGGGGGGSSDTKPPTVTAVDPPDGAVGVATDKPIVATFSEQISNSTVNTTSFFIEDDAGMPADGASVAPSGRKAFFTPSAITFKKGTLYHATLTTGITDVAGNHLAADKTWTFRTLVDEWDATTTSSAPLPRTSHTAVWTGDEMIIWGGDTSSGVTATGGRYDPVANTWSATTTTNAPSARTDHTAVWTGSKMIVWGGADAGGTPTITGAVYNPGTSPGTDTWTALPTTMTGGSALVARRLHTAVWTGSKMIVWGGLASGNTPTNTGTIYDPVANTWTALPTTFAGGNALAARVGHTAIWTGTDMIVWGGTISSTPVSTGARYSLATNRWTLIQNAPFGRSGHTAIWTGSEMIVWGGASSSQGARYNPTTDTWTSITTTNAPPGRVGNTAIWTGTEMIVWGGNAPSNQGAAYRPSTNTWRAITTTDAPVARTDHTAVWTGDEMIVWGGESSSGPENSGGLYTP